MKMERREKEYNILSLKREILENLRGGRCLQPTTEDVTMAIEIVEKIGDEVNKVVPKT